MFWMSRPPHLRRAAAVMVVIAAVAIEFRPVTTHRLATAAFDLPVGTTVTEADITWLEVNGPVDAIELPSVLTRSVPAGAPLSPADVDPGSVDVPADWLSIELEAPAATRLGATVVAVMSTGALRGPATGVVTKAPSPAGFETATAMIAFAPTDAVAVAHAVAEGNVTVLLGR